MGGRRLRFFSVTKNNWYEFVRRDYWQRGLALLFVVVMLASIFVPLGQVYAEGEAQQQLQQAIEQATQEQAKPETQSASAVPSEVKPKDRSERSTDHKLLPDVAKEKVK